MKYIINWKKDIKVERFAASSKGGQNANKTENNVRLTHLPSGIKSQATSERSLDQNFRAALSVLVSRIIEWLESQLEKRPSKPPASFGYQRRTYYLSYKNKIDKVIDHNTGIESSNSKILAGDIDYFIKENLK